MKTGAETGLPWVNPLMMRDPRPLPPIKSKDMHDTGARFLEHDDIPTLGTIFLHEAPDVLMEYGWESPDYVSQESAASC